MLIASFDIHIKFKYIAQRKIHELRFNNPVASIIVALFLPNNIKAYD